MVIYSFGSYKRVAGTVSSYGRTHFCVWGKKIQKINCVLVLTSDITTFSLTAFATLQKQRSKSEQENIYTQSTTAISVEKIKLSNRSLRFGRITSTLQ